MLLSACATVPAPAERRQFADTLAAAKGWQATELAVAPFTLVAYVPATIAKAPGLTVYIEGDGFAWLTGSQPSSDPTPRDPLALRLALAHPAGNAAYLARPCQYVDAERSACAQRYWTEKRFAPEAIDAANRAVDVLKQRFGAQQLTLVGYSGGGAVAALLAERRTDVARLVTVAGNLDHRAWTAHHRVQPLSGSLNAADDAAQLERLPQTHFIGVRDRVIPPELAQKFPLAMRGVGSSKLRIVADYDHHCCWADNWAQLWRERL